jgi:hypothetical protein
MYGLHLFFQHFEIQIVLESWYCNERPVSRNTDFFSLAFSGNGPSGIALSYLLAGNWPYYNGAIHPDEMLTARLSSAPPGRSIVKQDLRFLSQVCSCLKCTELLFSGIHSFLVS